MSDRSKSTAIFPTAKVQVSIFWLAFFRKMLSTNLRLALPIWQTEELNHLAAGLNQGKTDSSPRCDSDFIGFSSTPTLQGFLTSTTELDLAPIFFRGIKIIAPFPLISTDLIFPNLCAEDRFTKGLLFIDEIRLTFLNSLLRTLDEKYQAFVRCFGQKNLYELLSRTKQEIKVLITIFGVMISSVFSQSEMLRDFWSLLMKWLIFSRFTESVVTLITNMIQFPNGRNLVISNTGLEALKQLLQDITPVPSTTPLGVSISSEDETKRFVQNMRGAVDELMRFANVLSGHVQSTAVFDGHIEAIEISLKAMEKSTSPAKIARSSAKKMKFLDVEGLFKLLDSSGSSLQIIEMVHGMLAKERKFSDLKKFFQSGSVTQSDCGSKRRRETPPGRGIFFLECLSNIRIKCIEEKQKEVEALNSLTRAQIEHEKLQQELFLQKSITGRVLGDLRASLVPDHAPVLTRPNPIPVQAHVLTRPNPISVQAHVDLVSQQPFKRSRSHPSSEVQSHKRLVIGDIRDGLGDIRDGLGSTSKRSRQ